MLWRGTESATIVSRSPVTDVIDGVVQRTQTIVVQCDAGDYGRNTTFALTKADGTVANLTVLCGPVFYNFELTAIGRMFVNKRFVMRSICTYWSQPDATIADVLGSAPSGGGGGGSRRLLGLFDVFEDIVTAAGCASGFGPGLAMAGACDTDGGGGVSPAQLQELRDRLDSLSSAANNRFMQLERLQNATAEWRNVNYNLTRQTSQIQQDLAAAIQSTDARFQAQQMEANATADMVRSLAIAERTNADKINANFNNITQQISNVAAGIGAQLVTEFNRSYTTMNNLQQNVTAAIHALRDEVQVQFNQAYMRERMLGRGVRDLSTSILRTTQRFEEGRGFTRLLQDAIAGLPSGYAPFLLSLGRRSNATDASWLFPVETSRIVYVTAGGAAMEYTVSYTCNARHLLNTFRGWYTWKDFVETMGPPGCDPSVSSGNGQCLCFVTSQLSQCSAVVGAATTPAITTNLTLDGTACAGSIITFAATNHFSGNSVLSLLRDICISAGSVNVNVGSSLRRARLSYSNTPSACAISYDNLNAPSDGAGLPFVILSQWELTARNIVPNVPLLADYFDGVRPTGLTYRERPFLVMEDGQPGSCTDAAFTAYDSEAETVYRIDPLDVSAAATATVTGSVAVQGASPLIGVSILSLLPQGGTAVVGDPRSNATVYDIPNTLIGLTGGLTGTINYHMQPVISNQTQLAWEAFYNRPFDHFAEGPPAALFRTTVNASTGRCRFPGAAGNLSAYYAGVGSWCDLRSAYSVRSVVGQPDLMSLVPMSGGAYTVSFTVSEGDITQSLLSVCPTMSFDATGSGALLTFQNSRSAAVRVTVRINSGQGSAGCETTYAGLLVPAGGSFQQFVPRCNGGSTQQMASVARLLGNGTSVSCAGFEAVNITTSFSTFTSTFGNAGVLYVDRSTMTQGSSVAMALIDIVAQMSGLIQSSIISQAFALNAFGLTPSISWYNEAMERLGNLSVSINRTAYSVIPPAPLNDSDVAASFAAFQQALALARQAQARGAQEFNDAMSNLTRRVGEFELTTNTVLNETLSRLRRVEADYLAAERTLTDALGSNLTRALIGTFSSIRLTYRSPGLGRDLFRGFAGLMSAVYDEALDPAIDWIGDDGLDLIQGIGEGIVRLAEKAIDKATGFLDKLFAGLGNIMVIIALALGLVLSLAFAYFVVSLRRRVAALEQARGHQEVVSSPVNRRRTKDVDILTTDAAESAPLMPTPEPAGGGTSGGSRVTQSVHMGRAWSVLDEEINE